VGYIYIIGGGTDISPEGGRVLTYDIGLELSPKLPLFRYERFMPSKLSNGYCHLHLT
jgi:hypothetical protein